MKDLYPHRAANVEDNEDLTAKLQLLLRPIFLECKYKGYSLFQVAYLLTTEVMPNLIRLINSSKLTKNRQSRHYLTRRSQIQPVSTRRYHHESVAKNMKKLEKIGKSPLSSTTTPEEEKRRNKFFRKFVHNKKRANKLRNRKRNKIPRSHTKVKVLGS